MKNFKLISIILILALSVCVMIGCSKKNDTSNSTDTSTTDVSGEGNVTDETTLANGTENGEGETSGETSGENATGGSSEESTTAPELITEFEASLTFSESGCDISDTDAVSVSGKVYTITKAGTYTISGTMADGQIRVDIPKTEKATLLLNNFTGSCSDSAVIYVMSADEVYIDMEKESVNTLTDGNSYVFENPADDKPNACIYSSDDLTIKGGGTLNVIGNYNNGIGCKNDIDIKNGVVNVTAIKNAIKGNDSVTLRGDAVVNILDAKDGIKSDNTDKAGKGFVHVIEEAKLSVNCSDDAIQATQNVTITSGACLEIISASTDVNCDGTINIDDGCIVVKE